MSCMCHLFILSVYVCIHVCALPCSFPVYMCAWAPRCLLPMPSFSSPGCLYLCLYMCVHAHHPAYSQLTTYHLLSSPPLVFWSPLPRHHHGWCPVGATNSVVSTEDLHCPNSSWSRA